MPFAFPETEIFVPATILNSSSTDPLYDATVVPAPLIVRDVLNFPAMLSTYKFFHLLFVLPIFYVLVVNGIKLLPAVILVYVKFNISFAPLSQCEDLKAK